VCQRRQQAATPERRAIGEGQRADVGSQQVRRYVRLSTVADDRHALIEAQPRNLLANGIGISAIRWCRRRPADHHQPEARRQPRQRIEQRIQPFAARNQSKVSQQHLIGADSQARSPRRAIKVSWRRDRDVAAERNQHWGLGIGDWGLGWRNTPPIANPQPPVLSHLEIIILICHYNRVGIG
jgi:hypothetical protein